MSKELVLKSDSPPLREEDLRGVTEVVISDGHGNALEQNLRFANACGVTIRAETLEAQRFASVVFSGA